MQCSEDLFNAVSLSSLITTLATRAASTRRFPYVLRLTVVVSHVMDVRVDLTGWAGGVA
ncbi:hypothetical protein HDU96_002589, partial [Phlyctochytrium bullatum]